MKEVFLKKFWLENNTLFYLHFINDYAVRQVEISSNGAIFLSTERPVVDDAFLYDQRLSELEYSEKDFITKEEFELIYSLKKNDSLY